MWAVVIPVSLVCAHLTGMSIYWMFIFGQSAEALKCIFGTILLKRGDWVRQLVADTSLKGE